MKSFYSKIVEYGNLDSEYRGLFSEGHPLDAIALFRRMELIAPHKLLELVDEHPALDDYLIQGAIDRIVIGGDD